VARPVFTVAQEVKTMGLKTYGAETKRVFTTAECKRKARMIVAMLIELRMAPGEATDACRAMMHGIQDQIVTVAHVMRAIAEARDCAFTTTPTTQAGA
jgi:hypothetical protein